MTELPWVAEGIEQPCLPAISEVTARSLQRLAVSLSLKWTGGEVPTVCGTPRNKEDLDGMATRALSGMPHTSCRALGLFSARAYLTDRLLATYISHLHITSPWYSETPPAGTHVMPAAEPAVKYIGTVRRPGSREPRLAEHTLAGRTDMHTGNSHRGILEYALASAPPLLPAPSAFGLCSHLATGSCRERASAKQRLSPADPFPAPCPLFSQIASHSEGIIPNYMAQGTVSHCIQCEASDYTYWAWFPPRVAKSEAVLPQLRFSLRRHRESRSRRQRREAGEGEE